MKTITRRLEETLPSMLWLTAWILTLHSATPMCGEPADEERVFFRTRHQHAFEAYTSERNNPEKAIAYAFAAFDWAELATENDQRAGIAKPAIKACRQHLASSQEAAANYYLALNLGQLARTKWLGALKIVNEMEKRFHNARNLDATLDHGGPDRALSRLYLQAPSWPASIGNRKKAIKHAKAAIATAPHYPGNYLSYLEILLHQNARDEANKLSRSLPAIMKASREELKSDYWRFTWNQWEKTWKSLRDQLEEKSN